MATFLEMVAYAEECVHEEAATVVAATMATIVTYSDGVRILVVHAQDGQQALTHYELPSGNN